MTLPDALDQLAKLADFLDTEIKGCCDPNDEFVIAPMFGVQAMRDTREALRFVVDTLTGGNQAATEVSVATMGALRENTDAQPDDPSLRVVPRAQQEQQEEQDKTFGAELIGQTIPDVEGTEPRPIYAYLLYENFYNGREWKERLEHIALKPEDARAWVQADFPEGYSRTSIGITVFAQVDVPRSPASEAKEETKEIQDQDQSRSDH